MRTSVRPIRGNTKLTIFKMARFEDFEDFEDFQNYHVPSTQNFHTNCQNLYLPNLNSF